MKYFLTCLIVFLFNITIAQNYKFGKVSEAELTETVNPENPEAHATVLYKKQHLSYDFSPDEGFIQKNEFHERIKIYDQEGYKWANKKFRLYDKSNASNESISSLKAYTFTLKDGKVEKTKLKKEGIFEKNNNKYWSTTTITMPNVQAGCIIDIEYTIESQFIQIDDIILQYDIPIKTLDVQVLIPEYFNFKKIINPKAVFYPKFQDFEKDRKETIQSKSRSGNRVSQTTFKSSDLKFVENGFKINMNNIPALKSEPLVDNRDNYRSKISMEYEYYKGPNSELKYYSTDWNKVTSTIYKSENVGGQLSNYGFFKKDIDAIIGGITDPVQRINAIYNHVKASVKWNGFIGYSAEKGVKKAYKDGVGNVADINLLLTAMLNYAELSANPVLISTRDNGIPTLPSTSGFNYVIAAVEINDKVILLDASSNYATPNVLPKRILNWQGRIMRAGGSSAWVSLKANKKSKEINTINYSIGEDFSVTGKARTQLTNHLALNYRDNYANASEESSIKRLENNNAGITVSSLKVSNAKKTNKPITYSYNFKMENAIEEIGGNLYFSPLLFLTTEENIFKQDERLFPIDFIHPIQNKHTVNISLPKGYVVESLPESEKVIFNAEKATFSYFSKKNGENSIQLIIKFDLENTIIKTSEYNVFKDFFQFLVDKQSEKIVLKKA